MDSACAGMTEALFRAGSKIVQSAKAHCPARVRRTEARLGWQVLSSELMLRKFKRDTQRKDNGFPHARDIPSDFDQ